jgi:putative membrane protein
MDLAGRAACRQASDPRPQPRVGIYPATATHEFGRMEIMKRAIIVLGYVLLASPALAQSVGEKTGVNSMLGVAPGTADFVKEVAISDMFEIESSKLAEQKGNAPENSFAHEIVTDRTKTSTELKQLVSGGRVKAELPSALDTSHQSKLDKPSECP